jgi:integral membrane protein
MTNKSANIKTLTVTGYLEGVSFLLLLGLAMPLRHYLQINEPVRYIGMAHGFLFIGYIVILLSTASKTKLPLWAMPGGVISALLPFGPFIFDHFLKKSVNK